MSITVLISTRNESVSIAECIHSAWLLTDDVLVLDMSSSDDTARIAASLGAKVEVVPPAGYVEPARTHGIEHAQGEWVLILDADERLTVELAEEIKRIMSMSTPSPNTHYAIPRRNIFGSTWLAHGGWYPDRQIRLIHRPSFIDWPSRIHATPIIQGSQGVLTHDILHYFHGNLTLMVEKTTHYEKIEADLLHGAGRTASTRTFFRKYFGELYRRLILHGGYLDGMMGVIESLYQAYSKTITYLYLYENSRSK